MSLPDGRVQIKPMSSGRPLPTQVSELVLPYQAKFSHTLTSLKKSRLSVHNRLTSILEDSSFVTAVAAANNLPLVANERCGSWYVPPHLKQGSVYFKSTDGHQGQWSFSLRRLNLGLLEILEQHGGAIIVDSTRRGKSMPDALSKTVPIWVAVWNRVLFPMDKESHELLTPKDVVGRSEHIQIEERLIGHVRDLMSLTLDLDRLRSTIKKPIRVSFISRHTSVITVHQNKNYRTLICCSASRHEQGDGDIYVQGAGDDTENWAHGLTAELFWTHKDELTQGKVEGDIRDMIELLLTDRTSKTAVPVSQVRIQDSSTNIHIQAFPTDGINLSQYDAIINCGSPAMALPDTPDILVLNLGCPSGKLGGKVLRDKLALLDTFIPETISRHDSPGVLVLCSSGKDLSIGVALAILCRHVNDHGRFQTQPNLDIGKNFIKQRLACIIASVPDANPSRATLQSVNTYLMGHFA